MTMETVWCRFHFLGTKPIDIPMFHQPSRRRFLQTTAAAIASFVLAKSLLAGKPDKFWFIQKDTGNSWPVADPILWSLENARQPILERAREGMGSPR